MSDETNDSKPVPMTAQEVSNAVWGVLWALPRDVLPIVRDWAEREAAMREPDMGDLFAILRAESAHDHDGADLLRQTLAARYLTRLALSALAVLGEHVYGGPEGWAAALAAAAETGVLDLPAEGTR